MSAVFSDCGLYRYRLDRHVNMLGSYPVMFCMHNPSTGDAETNDPTLRRVISFSKTLGASKVIVVNIWAGISSDPKYLLSMKDPRGPKNSDHIRGAVVEISLAKGVIVPAWGVISKQLVLGQCLREWPSMVQQIFQESGCQTLALGINKDGSPKHPLYVRGDVAPSAWPR